MTSLIFGTIYMGHGAIVKHRQEKQRKKNYERWEGLRDEYDEMKKVTSQRTSSEYPQDAYSPRSSGQYPSADRDLFTLRDQQEANDARTSWRPQESWEQAPQRHSAQIGRTESTRLRPQKTGATWDEGLPAPLQVSRRSYDQAGQWTGGAPMSREASSSTRGRGLTPDHGVRTARSESVESERRRRMDDEVQVVESPFEWWRQ